MEWLFSGITDYFIPFIIILSILVFVHEFGHYWVARRCGVKIEVFSIGFGRELWGFTDRAGTRWKFCLIPFGGYVKMFGDLDPASARHTGKKLTAAERKVAFHTQPLWQRALIVFAGPAFNYMFAIAALALLFATYGQPYTSNEISKVVENSPAAVAGLEVGDRVLSINGRPTPRFEDIRRIVQINPNASLTLRVHRQEQVMNVEVVTGVAEQPDSFGDIQRFGQIGIISQKLEYVKHDPLSALWQGAVESYNLTLSTFQALGQIIAGTRSTDELGGPLRIAEMSGDVARAGFSAALFFTALLSINLGLINLFPIPVLDGGHLMFYAMEAVRGKPPGQRLQEVSSMVGLTAVIMLMVLATVNDLSRLNLFKYLKELIS